MTQLSIIIWGKIVFFIGSLVRLCVALQCLEESTPCVNNATCVTLVNGTGICRCAAGYLGEYCQYPDTCLSVSCHNGGTCIPLEKKEPNYKCHCKPGWTGQHCMDTEAGYKCINGVGCTANDPCSSKPCQNGGQCDSDPITGKYNCMCASGFRGSNCTEDTDECDIGLQPCENGGTCVNTLGSFKCSCPTGFSGSRCDVVLSECDSNPCLNGATCKELTGGYECLCMTGFSGTNCEVVPSRCATQHCIHCVTVENGYNCTCEPGWSGPHCDQYNVCRSEPCQHGGTCVDINGDFRCQCKPPFSGQSCETQVNLCLTNPCQGGGTCSMNISSPQGYTCTCKPGSSGLHCDTCGCLNGGSCQWSPTGSAICLCPAHFSGTKCEVPVTFVTSPGDLGSVQDAEAYAPQPWDSCPAELGCPKLFGNKRCDLKCNSAQCLFDDFECQAAVKPCRYITYCTDYHGNGYCDKGCDNEECGWDGLDCAASSPAHLLNGTLELVVLVPPEELKKNLSGLLHSLSLLLHTNLRVYKDAQGEPVIYPYYGPEARHTRARRELNRKAIGSRVLLEIDNSQCVSQSHSSCFSSTAQAAAFLTANVQGQPLPYPMVSARASDKPDDTIPAGPPGLLYLIAMAGGVVLLLMVVLAVRRKRKHGALWLPEGFLITGRKRREPLGQDEMDLKYMLSASRDLVKPGSEEQVATALEHSWLHREQQMVDDGLLPAEGGAGDADPREWTPQHHRVVDLTLRVPHAQLVLDCPDVNVRGPGGLTPLMLASLCHGVSVDCDSQLGEEAETEEEEAEQEAGPSIITDLVALGAGLQARTDGTGEMALHLAARYARADATKRLLDAGADVNARDRMGRTPLHAAVAADAQGVFQILIRNRATELNSRMNDGTTPLILAARLAVEDMVDQLVHCHVDINAVDDHGKSALHWAAAVNNVEAVVTLVKNGANWDLQDIKEETPLFLAAREGSFDAARILLEHCCSRDIADHLDRRPRDVAQERMHHDIVQLLDRYNLAPRPEHLGSATPVRDPGTLVCANAAQGRKGRRAGCGRPTGEEMKAKRRKKPGVGAGPAEGLVGGVSCPAEAAGLSAASPCALSPANSLESPHTGDTVTSALLVATAPTHMPRLPPVSHMLLCQHQGWREQGIMPGQFSAPQPGPVQCYQLGGGRPTEQGREQLPVASAFRRITPGGALALLDQGQNGVLSHPQGGAAQLPFDQAQTFVPSGMTGVLQPLPQLCSFGHSLVEAPPLRSVLLRDSPVDNYPTPPSQHSYITPGLDGATSGLRVNTSTEHPFLTPSPESPDPWSSSSSPSPHSASDWSDTTTSPVPVVNSCVSFHPNHPHTPQGVPLLCQQQKHAPNSMNTRS